jgi:eukaryotic-like serine/threonine-protein kinase
MDLIGSRLGSYQILSHLGAGGMGEVYRARDTKLGRDVAIKIIPPSFASDPDRLHRFEREARTLASLSHPNIGAIHGFEEAGDVRGLVLELIEGPTLADRLNNGPLPLKETLAVARQIADALDAAHEKGIVHRDLKPANIKIAPGGTVKVLDFGLAKAFVREGEDAPTVSLGATRDGEILGTPAYMSPEQARGQAIDKRTDIWAFGCILYEMLAGRAAFARGTLSDTIANILEHEPDWNALPQTTPVVRRLLERCLEKDSKRRLRDIGDARIELEQDVRETAVLQASPPLRRTRNVTRMAIAVVAVTGLALAVLAFWRQPVNPRPVRLSVVAPKGTAFTIRDITEHPQFALSPDGSRLAFVAGAPGEHPMVWVRSLESGTAQPLAGSEGGSGPFWAPDSRSVAFFARGKLKKISLDSAAVQELADIFFDVQTGTWSPQGVILFSAGAGGALMRVPAEGGPVTAATALDATRNETVHRWPQFLPDGRRYLVFVGSTTPENAGVYLGSIDSASKTLILPSETNAVYAEPEYLLFEQNGVLTKQSFDAQSGVLSGQPETTGDPILGLRGPRYLPLSVARNGTLAYWNASLTPTDLQWFDRSGRPLGKVGSAGRYDAPMLSPDGTKVIATLRENPNATEIWRFDVSGGGSSRLTFTRGNARFGIWSPDGQHIVSSAGLQQNARIFQMAASGAGQETFIEGTGKLQAVFPEDWSRDARWLIYDVTSQTAFDVWALDLSNSKAAPILQTPANEVQPRLSPNGLWLAYASDETGTWEVYVQGFGQTRGKWQVSKSGGSQPAWRRDGKELFYVGNDGRLFAVPVTSDKSFEFGSPQALFQTMLPPVLAPFRAGYAVSADGQRFLLNTLHPNPEPSVITTVLNWTARQ